MTKLIQIFSSDVLPCNDPQDDAFSYNLYHRRHTYRGVRQCVLNCVALYLTHARNNGRKNYNGISSPGPSVPSSINLSLKKNKQIKQTRIEQSMACYLIRRDNPTQNDDGQWPISHSNTCKLSNFNGPIEIFMGTLQNLMGPRFLNIHVRA